MRKLLVSVAALAFAASACTVRQTDVPSVGGPSTAAISLRVTATPDTLPQNGTAQSSIAIQAFNAGGQPYPNLTIRLDMQVNGATQDLGTLSTRTITTKSDGTATAVYTAPVGPGPGGLGSTVAVVATPIASDAANSGILNSVGTLFQAYVHLVPDGNSIPPRTETPTPSFTVTPASPTAGAIALFNGNASCPSGTVGTTTVSCAAANSTIVSYDWDFGDASTHGSGVTTTHAYTVARSYPVTLTVVNSQGGRASITSVVTVGAGTGPSARFTALPNPADINTAVNLDGSPSTGQIVNYAWAITSPTAVVTRAGGPTPTTNFTPNAIGAWTVTLTVTDVNGQSNTSAATTVNVK